MTQTLNYYWIYAMTYQYICEQCSASRSHGSRRFCRRCSRLNRIIKAAKEICGDLGTTEQEFRAAVVILSSLKIGQNIKALWDFTRYPPTEILAISRNLKASGIWENGLMYFDSEWDDPDLTWLIFLLYLLVATGVVQRVPDEDRRERSDG